MKLALGTLALVGTLVACNLIRTNDQKIEAGCIARGESIKVLTLANNAGKLNAIQRDKVDEAVKATSGICTAATPPTLTQAAQQAFENAIALLGSTAASVK